MHLALPVLLAAKIIIRPYHPPELAAEPAIAPTEVQVVEIRPQGNDIDAQILARPWYGAPMAGAVARGARIPVRGQVQVKNGRGCPTHLYYAVDPTGYLCSRDGKPTTQPASTESVVALAEGSLVPFRYVMVGVKDGFLPMWATLADLKGGAEPERQLKKGDTIAVRSVAHHEGVAYYVSVDEKVAPVKGTFELSSFSEWQGVAIDQTTHLPFGWITPEQANVLDAPGGHKVGQLPRRTRVDILEEQKVGSRRLLRISEGQWVSADAVNEVRRIDRPSGTGDNPQWFDVDLGEQVVVAYEGAQPVYATLTSSGREPNHTPRGNYPLWGKVSSITMKSQEYDDVPYYVNRVPWVLFFQAHNALHGAYWHDRFGMVKSHGCANLAPRDARHFFDWIRPALPSGWTSVLFYDLTQSPVVHVRNSHNRVELFQERNIGPPDRADEADRLEQAVSRREAKERAEEAAKTAPPNPTVPASAGGPATPGPSVVPVAPPLAPPSSPHP
jgi:hypothetical protein